MNPPPDDKPRDAAPVPLDGAQREHAIQSLVLITFLQSLTAEIAAGPAGTCVRDDAIAADGTVNVPKMFAGRYLQGPHIDTIAMKSRRIEDMLSSGHTIAEVQRQLAMDFAAEGADSACTSQPVAAPSPPIARPRPAPPRLRLARPK